MKEIRITKNASGYLLELMHDGKVTSTFRLYTVGLLLHAVRNAVKLLGRES